MKRLDNKTCNLMNRLVLPLLFGALLIAPIMSNFANAGSDTVQQWTQGRATMGVNARLPNAELYAAKVNITNVASSISFDPRELDKSSIVITAAFIPVDPPRGLDAQDIQRDSSAMFESTSIRQTNDTTFQVIGNFKNATRTQVISFPMTVAYGGNKGGNPALMFSGDMSAPLGDMMPGLGLPKYVPLSFMIETAPAP